jgi:hypothetical protein
LGTAYPFHFIGGSDGDLLAGNALHEIGDELVEANGVVYLLVRIRLFAAFGAPTYLVVTGLPKSLSV